MTQAEAQRAVHKYGGIRPAARALDMPYSNFYSHLHPDKVRETHRIHQQIYYERMTNFAYNRKLLRNRRYAALRRNRQREERAHGEV